MQTPVSTRPDDWFLLDRENDSTTVSPFTANNLVEALVDGETFMKKLHEIITDTKKGDYIFHSGWGLAPDARLIGTDANSQVSTVLKAARGRGVATRLLLSHHLSCHISGG